MKDFFFDIKSLFTLTFTTINLLLGNFAIAVYMLVFVSITDYITGLCAAPYRGESISSYKSILGIYKKIGILVLVAVGMVLDWLVVYSAHQIGFGIEIKYAITSVVSIWLISNELISILENLIDLGVSLPSFLLKIAEKIKSASDASLE